MPMGNFAAIYHNLAVQKMSEELGFDYRFIPWEEAEDE